jgi:hypothetical protein
LGVLLELPPGVPIFFPSALFTHGNVDRTGVFEAETEEEVRGGKGIPRGSFVFYAQSTWIQLAELGITAGEAKKRKLDVRWTGLDDIFKF